MFKKLVCQWVNVTNIC